MIKAIQKMEAEIQAIDDDIERLARWHEALSLLNLIWAELGPYSKDLQEDTLRRLNNFMHWDDSE